MQYVLREPEKMKVYFFPHKDSILFIVHWGCGQSFAAKMYLHPPLTLSLIHT